MTTLHVNGRRVTVDDEATILDAARAAVYEENALAGGFLLSSRLALIIAASEIALEIGAGGWRREI